MNPGIAVMPRRSIAASPAASAVPDTTDAMRPPRITIEPRSITLPLPTTIRAFVMTRSCATAVDATQASHAANNLCMLPPSP